MTSKQFLFEAPDATEPVNLEINGETIRCVPTLDGLRLLIFTSIMYGNFGVGVRSKEMVSFLEDCVLPEDWDNFQGLVKKYSIDIEGLGDITTFLSDVYAERPTGSAQPSSAGQQTTGPSSEESSSSPASTIPI
jgi:hypothetical protein